MRRTKFHRRPRHNALALAALLTIHSLPAPAAVINWVGPNASFWDLAVNWSAGIPLTADDVLLGAFDTEVRSGLVSVNSFTGTGRLRLSGGTLRAASGSSIGVLDLAGGTLSGKGTVTAASLTWTAGTMGEYEVNNFGGTTNVSGLTTISGNTGKQLYYGRTLNLNGGANWSGAGSISMTDATSIAGQPIAAATITLPGGQTFTDQGNGAAGRSIASGVFNNFGVYQRTAGTGSTTITAQFNNSGATNVGAGTLFLQGGGTHTGGFSTVAGSTLSFNAGVHSFTSNALSNAGTIDFAGSTSTLNGTMAFTGNVVVSAGLVTSPAATTLTADSLNLSGGTTRLQGNVPIGALTLSGGILSGKGTTSVATLAWTAGTMGEYEVHNFGGTTNVSGLATISGNTGKQVYYGRTLNLNGGATWSGAGSISMTDATSIAGQPIAAATINLPGGQTFDDQGNGAAGRSIASGVFNNAGTYTRSAGTGSTTISAQFNNSGATNVGAGTLFLQGGGTHTGSFSTVAGSTLSFNAGVHSFTSNALSNAGTIDFAGSTSTLNGTMAFTGNVVVSAGLVTSPMATTLTAESLNLSGGTTRLQGNVPIGALSLNGGTLSGKGATGVGTLAWTAGTLGEYEVNNFGGTTNVSGLTTISGNTGKQLYYGRTLNLNGGATWSGAGSISMTDATTIAGQPIAAATINLPGGQTFTDQGNGAAGRSIASGVFNNAGIYQRTAGTGSTTITAQFNNQGGAVNVGAGTLFLQGGGTHTGGFSTVVGSTLSFNAGIHSFTSNALSNAGTIDFAGSTSTLNGTMAFTGNVIVSAGLVTSPAATTLTANSLNLSGGTTRLQGNVPVTALTLSGGTLSGKGTTSVGTLAWTAGTMGEYEVNNFGGTTNVSGLTTISGNTGKQLYYGRTLNLNGGATWSGAGSISMTDATSIAGQPIAAATINLPGGQTFTDQGNGAAGRSIASGVFNNAGTYTRSAGTGSTTITAQFNNSGATNVGAGTLFLQGGGTHTGSFSTVAGSTLSFNAGVHSFTSNALSNAGTIDFAGSTSTLNGTMAFTGNVVVSAGLVTSPVATTLTADSLNLSGGTTRLQGNVPIASLTVSGGTLSGKGTTSVGTLAWTAGTMGEYEVNNFGGTTNVSGLTTISGNTGKQLYYGRTLNLNGGAVWSGAGSISMTDATSIAGQPIAAATINLPGGQTFTDQGNGAAGRSIASGVFNNAGTYLRSAGTGSTTVTSVFTNTGRVQVDAGVLIFGAATSLQGPTGTLVTGPGGRADLTAGNSTVGTLQNNGSAANALDLGTRTITVFTDYDNANFGVGNAFNRRANVATSGVGNRLIAGGNANQALAGPGIVGGTTATPTLFLGAVHVGVNTITYDIQNVGTSGPALRGAVQTVFAGGGITDPRLSGDGASSSSWGAVATGSAVTRTVTFTVDQAGLLTAVTNQSVRIVNNFDNTLSQVLNISSSPGYAAYNLAAASVTPNPVQLPNQRVGGTLQTALAITNSAPIGSFTEGLNVSFGAITGSAIANGGSITRLAGAQTDTTSMTVRLDTSTAGAKNGTALLNLASDGTGTSGLGITALAPQTVAISGNVYRLASASAVATPVVIPNQRVGANLSQALTLANTAAADGFSERLNASFVNHINQGSAVTSGSIGLLAAGASDSTTLRVGVDSSSAGPKSGIALLTLASDGAGTSGFAALALASQPVNVSGNVYRLANPSVQNALVLAARVGDALPGRSIAVSNLSPDVYAERLDASLGAVSPAFSGSGAITGLQAGASSNAFGFTLNSTAVAGSTSGNAVVTLVSSGAGTTLAPDAALGTANVALTGRVYAPAVAQLNTTVVDFGTVRVGDSVALRGVSVSNTASGALTDSLRATHVAASGPFVAVGGVGGLAAGSTSANGLQIALNTGAAGVFNGSSVVTFTSQNPDMVDLALGTSNVALRGQVNNIAQSVLQRTSGAATLSNLGLSYTLNFGTLVQGAAPASALLSLTNTATGPADALAGSFDLSALLPGDVFSVSGFAGFSGLQAGDILSNLQVSFATGDLGVFDRVLVLNRTSTNGVGPDLPLASLQLHLQGQVVAVPEPGTWVLMLGGVLLLASRLRARQKAA